MTSLSSAASFALSCADFLLLRRLISSSICLSACRIQRSGSSPPLCLFLQSQNFSAIVDALFQDVCINVGIKMGVIFGAAIICDRF